MLELLGFGQWRGRGEKCLKYVNIRTGSCTSFDVKLGYAHMDRTHTLGIVCLDVCLRASERDKVFE